MGEPLADAASDLHCDEGNDRDPGSDVDEEYPEVVGAAPVLTISLRLTRVDSDDLYDGSRDQVQRQSKE